MRHRLAGTVPNKIFNLTLLEHFHLFRNNLNGSIELDLLNLNLGKHTFHLLLFETISLLVSFTFYSDVVAIESNNFIGGMMECNSTSMHADCKHSRKIECDCYQCYGHSSTPTNCKLETPCLSSELVIIYAHSTESESFEVMNRNNENIASGTLILGEKHGIRTSETESYTFDIDYFNYLQINNY